MTNWTIEALLAALDDCALGLNRAEAIARIGLDNPKQAKTALLSILSSSEEAKRNVLDIIEELETKFPQIRD